MLYTVISRVVGMYTVEVEAENKEEAEEMATRMFEVANFGDVENIDLNVTYVFEEGR